MKNNLIISFKLTLILVLICAGLFPLLISFIGQLTPGGGEGRTVIHQGRVVGYEHVGQNFSSDRYFWGRPSAVGYNAAGSGGSNKGPSNPDYLITVQARIDTFLVHHPSIRKEDIPAEMVTASGSGLDPHISPGSAYVQVDRISDMRQLSKEKIMDLVTNHVEPPFLGLVGPEKINVLKLNIALDQLK